jgi:hypothetical protein
MIILSQIPSFKAKQISGSGQLNIQNVLHICDFAKLYIFPSRLTSLLESVS